MAKGKGKGDKGSKGANGGKGSKGKEKGGGSMNQLWSDEATGYAWNLAYGGYGGEDYGYSFNQDAKEYD